MSNINDKMNFSTKVENGYVICSIKGRLLINDEVEQILQALDVLISDCDVVMELNELDYVSSSGLALFIRLLTKTRIKGKKLILVGMKENVLELFKITKLNNIFTTALTVANASQNLK